MTADEVFRQAPPLPVADRQLVEDYRSMGRPLDALPYTDEFDEIERRAHARGDERDANEIWHRLVNLRKAGRLPRIGRDHSPSPSLNLAEEELMQDLAARYAGTVGRRDQLPYTGGFSDLAEEFRRRTGRDYDNHTIWRLLSRVAKFGD